MHIEQFDIVFRSEARKMRGIWTNSDSFYMNIHYHSILHHLPSALTNIIDIATWQYNFDPNILVSSLKYFIVEFHSPVSPVPLPYSPHSPISPLSSLEATS